MMCEKTEEKDLNISVEKLLDILNSHVRRQDGEFIFRDKKYKYSAYVINQFGTGEELYRIDVREVKT